MNLSAILDAVSKIDDEREIDVLHDALRDRSRTLRANKGRQVLATLQAGQRVRIGAISPKYLSGLEATVERVDTKHVHVKFGDDDFYARKYRGAVVGIPPSCVEAIA